MQTKSHHNLSTTSHISKDVTIQEFGFENLNLNRLANNACSIGCDGLRVYNKDCGFHDISARDRKYSMEATDTSRGNGKMNENIQEKGTSLGCSFDSFSDLSSYSCLFS